MRESARLVASIRDQSKVDGVRPRDRRDGRGRRRGGQRRAGRGAPRERRRPAARPGPGAVEEPPPAPRQPLPHLRDPRFTLERETLKLVLQHPMSIGRTTTEIGADDFTHPTYRAVWELVEASGGTVGRRRRPGWVAGLRERATDPAVAAAVTELGVEPLEEGADGRLRRAARRRPARAHRAAPDRRPQVAAAAHQPGRARRGVQPDVRRAGRARGAPPQAARPDRRTTQ